MPNIYILHLHMVLTFTLNWLIFDNVGSKFLKIYPIFGNFCKLFEKYELEKRYRGILFYSFQYIVTWLSISHDDFTMNLYADIRSSGPFENLIYIA